MHTHNTVPFCPEGSFHLNILFHLSLLLLHLPIVILLNADTTSGPPNVAHCGFPQPYAAVVPSR